MDGEDMATDGVAPFDVGKLQDYLAKVCPVVLDGDEGDFANVIRQDTHEATLKSFANDSQIRVLLVHKHTEPSGDDGESDKENSSPNSGDAATFTISVDMQYPGKNTSSVAFIKRHPVLDAERSLAKQVQLLNFGDASPFDSIHSFIHDSISPFFSSYVEKVHNTVGEHDQKIGIPAVKRKMAELEVSLRHCQQNVEIPEPNFIVEKEIKHAVAQAASHGKQPDVGDLGDIVSDTSFLNRIQRGVGSWIREIQKVTKLDRDPSQGTTMQEINFWLNLEHALLQLENQTSKAEIQFTLAVLDQAKRHQVRMGFKHDGALDEAKERAKNYNQMMKDFPINELLTATSIDRITDAVNQVFGHISKKLKMSFYPNSKIPLLIEAISRDLTQQLLKILAGKNLMRLSFKEFERLTESCNEVFKAWGDAVTNFRDNFRDYFRKRGNAVGVAKLRIDHEGLQNRIIALKSFRRQHEELQVVIVRILGGPESLESDINASKEVEAAFESVADVDVLDISKEGDQGWEDAKQAYESRIDRVESQITKKLRDRLGAAKNANEMFRVFSKFNALFVRPRIRGAIEEYQTQLIERVAHDIAELQNKFIRQYHNSEAYVMSDLRDLPPVAGAIIWAKQIERQLDAYMKRIGDVLGSGWEDHAEAQKLKEIGDNFRSKLDTAGIFQTWLNDAKSRKFEVKGYIFSVRSNSGKLDLSINFDPSVTTLFKETRNLTWLGFRVPYDINIPAGEAKGHYPFAQSLLQSIRTYQQATANVRKDMRRLVAGFELDVQKLVSQGVHLKWDVEEIPEYTRSLAHSVLFFQEKCHELERKFTAIDDHMKRLSACSSQPTEMRQVLNEIQGTVDEMNLASYSNLAVWVSELDARVEALLVKRLEDIVQLWIGELSTPLVSDEEKRRARRKSKFEDVGMDEDQGYKPSINRIVHEIVIQNQVLCLEPPLENARRSLVQQLHDCVCMIVELPRIQSARYDDAIGQADDNRNKKTYRSLLTGLKDDLLHTAYEAVESHLAEVSSYVTRWLGYQSLWDIESASLYTTLGEDLVLWQELLIDIKKSRSTVDNSETEKEFGPITIDYRQVQAKVNHKYDSWHKEILGKFGTILGDRMKQFYSAVSAARMSLESSTVDAGTAQVVNFVTLLQDMKRKMKAWSGDVDHYRSGQRLLEKQRFQFPTDWLYFDNIEGEWSAFCEILNRKTKSVSSEIPNLQMKILAEDRAIEQKQKDLVAEWSNSKPVDGATAYTAALETLAIFEGRITRLKEEHERIRLAKDALDMEPSSTDALDVLDEELSDLKSVWVELSKSWQMLDSLKETPWSAVIPRKIRSSLEDVLQSLKSFPSRMRQYACFDYFQKTVKSYLKVNALISDLRSDCMKERHWKHVMQKLRLTTSFSELSLGSLWDADVSKAEKTIRDILTQAQGEMGLETYLKQVQDCWDDFTLDLVAYKTKCRLIRGWDELFGKASEHINFLTSMRLSPYFKVFEDEVNRWDEKINRIRNLFDVWIDVQRRWVYLEGIFLGNSDIQQQLPAEHNRFRNIDGEFVGLMRKVSLKPKVLDVLVLPDIQKVLERLGDSLNKIQKALGEYLERERSSFPRFYFVGDEDLLEIIGNCKEPSKVQKHLSKMFAGLSTVVLEEDEVTITGMVSREGEVVPFVEKINVAENSKINVWLGKVEAQMRLSLAASLEKCLTDLRKIWKSDGSAKNMDTYLSWLNDYPAQLVVLACQVLWTETVESAFGKSLPEVLKGIEANLSSFADNVLGDLPIIRRKKLEHLITELVHQRDVTRKLIKDEIPSSKDFGWLYYMRYYFHPKEVDPLKKLEIRMANASIFYGYEYLGVQERLVQTPLTDRCYLTLTQALHSRLGGSPFGPAGTGKTETVKALGSQLGRFVLVFNCDDTFDLQAMGRIFVGLCQCGAWGCFDEFNRLEERILSAVSQQILTIQQGLRDHSTEIEVVGKNVKLNDNMGIFVTMNPGYAGRSQLPDNLKALFRNVAMIKPDRELIAQVMLYSQGFRSAEILSGKVVPLFKLCDDQLSPQPHYDFGLRALKSVLVSAGNLKRMVQGESTEPVEDWVKEEVNVLIRSICETVVPKLVAADIPLLHSLISDVFPDTELPKMSLEKLVEAIKKLCVSEHYATTELWLEKMLQLYQIQSLHHGVMMVGPSGSGKSAAWRILLEAMETLDGVKGEAYVLDPKAITKEELYGNLDPTTREWTDGVFTSILRRIVDNVRGEMDKRHWIVFDGDVDPLWVENLNSVLDDNKMLTLPNGERLNLPPNVKVMFEVQDLKYATLATVSRCGMVWFSEETLCVDTILGHYLERLREEPLDPADEKAKNDEEISPQMRTQQQCAEFIASMFAPKGLIEKALDYVKKQNHVMEFTPLQSLESMFSLVKQSVVNVLEYNQNHLDFPMSSEHMEKYITRRAIVSILWGFGGSMKLDDRTTLGDELRNLTSVQLPDASSPLLDFEVRVDDGEWHLWRERVPTIDIEVHKVVSADVVIPTIDTVRHEDVIHSWLADHKPLLLCGPPGSGKSMTLLAVLRSLPDFDLVYLNFSSTTTPELILKTFEQYCEYRKTSEGMVLRPNQVGKWVVVFCDEINLPENDKFGTQKVISFMRQMIEHGGFWRPSDVQWVRLDRIQFLGACNPPTDPGRVALSPRFLRHAPLIMVDYPSSEALIQIYGTFNRALMKLHGNLRAHADPTTYAMVDFYTKSQKRFTADVMPHYIYSPRELSRWVRAMYEAMHDLDAMTMDEFLRLFVHEALRIFQDRLATAEERDWTDEAIDDVVQQQFPTANMTALSRPILFSKWLTQNYTSVDREELREHVKERLRVFNDEELNVPLVIFNGVLDHILRIDRVLRQPLGHVLLIGVSGAGKTVLSRFVAWMNKLEVFQIKVSRQYSTEDFNDDLRAVMKRAGCKGEKICFIFDESNILKSAFLEQMNALLASGEVPGLFEGDEYASLINGCKEAASRDNLILDSEEELYKRFIQQVQRNLHVVFTMNPAGGDFKNRSATSPALFNRCVVNWMGDWPEQAVYQVAYELTKHIDLDAEDYNPSPLSHQFMPSLDLLAAEDESPHRVACIESFVYIHKTVHDATQRIGRRQGRFNYITPRHYLDFLIHFKDVHTEKREELEEQQLHLNVGLQKLKDTEVEVAEMQQKLAAKNEELEAKNKEAEAKLKEMVNEQQEAEQKKQEAIALSAELDEKNKVIDTEKEKVNEELAEVEPAIQAAKDAVNGIRRPQLDEVRKFPKPPELVRFTLEAVSLLLGEKKPPDWDGLRKLIMKGDFIASVVSFDTETISPKAIELLNKNYLSNENFNVDKVNHSSKACGPLCQWVISQLKYAEILGKVQPLRDQINELEEKSSSVREKHAELMETIAELEKSIATFKEEYALLISETQAIKQEMTSTQEKVERSTKLLGSLNYERQRWESESTSFKSQMGTLVGDVVLASAFLTYSGYFDQHYRSILLQKWQEHLDTMGVVYKNDLSLIEYLSRPDDRLRWQSNSLPADDLCIENAIILNRFNRYPLVIDPSAQATSYVMNEYQEAKIGRTSFLDDSFIKKLESSLRFGTPLLIQDVENIDPILNSVLNKEVYKTGGRALIRLGDQEIDFSPAFNMFLQTRDPTFNFAPDLCSRVTFVNFTVTPSSLQSQTLNEVLKAESPETDKKRSDLLKLQGEFKVKLRQLEEKLLGTLSAMEGNILDDSTVMNTLETLKKESAEIEEKYVKTDVVMAEISEASDFYLPLATACSRVYFAMEQLAEVHFLYQFSLQFFLDIFHDLLHNNKNLAGTSDPKKRMDILMDDLFSQVYRRVSAGLLQEDHLTFAIRLAKIRLEVDKVDLDENEFEFLLKGGAVTKNVDSAAFPSFLNSTQLRAASEMSQLKVFKDIGNVIKHDEDSWKTFFNGAAQLPSSFDEKIDSKSDPQKLLRRVIALKHFRPDMLVSGMQAYVNAVLGENFTQVGEVDLKYVVETESKAQAPLILCSIAGYDASHKVDDLARSLQKQYSALAMGSEEGFDLADKAVMTASRQGSWVLLKNVHLSPAWLVQLEKKLQRTTHHANFRLFMSMEINPAVPVNLLRMSQTFVFEPPMGLKASLSRTLRSIPQERMNRAPAERGRLYFLLAWFHAILQERLRYTPVGWSKVYEFGDADQRCAIDVIDHWVDNSAQGRANLAPEKIPWEALRTLLSESVYGGRVDNEFDIRLLQSFVNHLFDGKSYDVDFPLTPAVGADAAVTSPDGVNVKQFLEWVDNIENAPPTWLGLPNSVETMVLTNRGHQVISRLLKMRSAYDEESGDQADDDSASSALKSVKEACQRWLKTIPEKLSKLKQDGSKVADPLFRCFERELDLGAEIIQKMRVDLQDIIKITDGDIKPTNHHRDVMNALSKELIPQTWRLYTVDDMPVSTWVADFADRVKQLDAISAASSQDFCTTTGIMLGRLFSPEAFITATRQAVAQRKKWALESLRLELSIGKESADDDQSFIIKGLMLEGGEWADQRLSLGEALSGTLPSIQFRWVQEKDPAGQLTTPVYLASSRRHVLFTVQLPAPSDVPENTWYQRGLAMLAWSKENISQ